MKPQARRGAGASVSALRRVHTAAPLKHAFDAFTFVCCAALRRVHTAAPLKQVVVHEPDHVLLTPPCSHGGSIEALFHLLATPLGLALRRVHTAAPLKRFIVNRQYSSRGPLRRVHTAAPLKRQRSGLVPASTSALRRVHTAAPLKRTQSPVRHSCDGHSAVFTRRLH